MPTTPTLARLTEAYPFAGLVLLLLVILLLLRTRGPAITKGSGTRPTTLRPSFPQKVKPPTPWPDPPAKPKSGRLGARTRRRLKNARQGR